MEFVTWFLISALILQIPAALFAYIRTSDDPCIGFLEGWKINQVLPIGGGIYAGLVAVLT